MTAPHFDGFGYLVGPLRRDAYLRRCAYAKALDRCLRVFRRRLRLRAVLDRAARPGAYDFHRFELRRALVQVDRAAIRAESLSAIVRRRASVAFVRSTPTKGSP